jgi:hypothetical protein
MDEDHTRISHPDWHSASWLTADELARVIDAYESIEFPERSWFQLVSPDKQPIPENATATKMECRFSSRFEWYVEQGEKRTYQVPITVRALLAAMRELDGDRPGRSRLVFWFDN